MQLEFYHLSDPANKQHRWPFVYLHGAAERHNEEQQRQHGDWKWEAPDLFEANQPMPVVEGDYPAMLYGMRVVAFLRMRHDHLHGRVASPDGDTIAFLHAQNVKEWR